jgi:hypothetical protein
LSVVVSLPVESILHVSRKSEFEGDMPSFFGVLYFDFIGINRMDIIMNTIHISVCMVEGQGKFIVFII